MRRATSLQSADLSYLHHQLLIQGELGFTAVVVCCAWGIGVVMGRLLWRSEQS